MSREIRESLEYDCRYNLFLVTTTLPNVRNIQERQNAVRWLRFLKSCAKTVDQMKLRNDFMYYLVLNVQEGSLKAPFDKPPPNLPIKDMAKYLPTGTDGAEDTTGLGSTRSGVTIAQDAKGSARKSEILRRSSDGGDFLLSQPIPDVGAFCYLAVVSKKAKN